MKISSFKNLNEKNLIVFDLDGTIIPSKSPMDAEMSEMLVRLLRSRKVCVIGGGRYQLFHELFLKKLKCPKNLLERLFLFPTTATVFYKYNHGWKKVYSLPLSKSEVAKVKRAFRAVFKEIGYKHPEKTYGEIIENRGTQVSFSVYGQDIARVLGRRGVEMKKRWMRKNFKTKMKITRLMAKKLPNLEVRAAGLTTIDVTRKGIDKAFGIQQIKKYLRIPVDKMIFIGDAIFPGGNDYAVIRTGVDYISVKGPKDTKKIIRTMLKEV